MDRIIKEHISHLKALCEKYEVKTMHVFGSAAKDKISEKSDIDILISFKDISIELYTDNYFNLHDELENLFNRKVDLVTDKSLSNPYFKKSIEQTKQLLYAA